MNIFFASQKKTGSGSAPPPPDPTYSVYLNGRIVCDGNSLTLGGYDSSPYPSQLSTLINAQTTGVTVYNKGVNAQDTLDMIADAASDIDSLYTGAAACLVMAWEVGNDLYFNDGNVALAMENIETYCLGRRAAGFKVFLLGIMDRQQPTLTQTEAEYKASIDAANSAMRANWSTFADAFVDLAVDSRLADASNLTYFNADKVHLKNAGCAVVAELVMEKMLEYSVNLI